MEKMKINQAREYLENPDQHFGDLGHAWDHVLWEARGFVEAWDSQQKEIDKLQKAYDDLACQLRVKLAEDVLREEK